LGDFGVLLVLVLENRRKIEDEDENEDEESVIQSLWQWGAGPR
jgi:hypothetical protein